MRTVFITTLFIISLISITNCQNLKNGNYVEKIGDLKLNYSIKGNCSEVMLIGHPNSGKIGYELSLQPLEDSFKIIYYDPRGTGKSEAPTHIKGYNQDSLVQEIDNLRKKLGVKKIWLFAHSDQSAIALIYALKFPQYTKGLIITGTSLIGTQAETYERRKHSEAIRSKESEWFAQVIKDWDYMFTNKVKINKDGQDISNSPLKWWCYNEETAQKVISIANEISKVGRRKQVAGKSYKETSNEREKYLSYQLRFKEITAPILIVNGIYDTNNPPDYVKKLHEVLPTSNLILIDNSGHFPWIENREVTFNAINTWLSEYKRL